MSTQEELAAEVERLRTWIRKGNTLRRAWDAEERAERAIDRAQKAEAKVARQRRILAAANEAARRPDATGHSVKRAMNDAWLREHYPGRDFVAEQDELRKQVRG